MILVTGGCGFIGSHTCVELISAGYNPIILDNFCNSHPIILNAIKKITGIKPHCIEGDIRNASLLEKIFQDYPVQGVIHFAALKAVGESVELPLNYYNNNVQGTLELLFAMKKAKIKTFVFSSSATVYGHPHQVPIKEDFPFAPVNPYGRSKMMVEHILEDLYISDPSWKIARLRYFNPIGAHESGLIGENPKGKPNNLMPYLLQVAEGEREYLPIFGHDYSTIDGTGVRDYIHVMDLANGHVKALNYLFAKKSDLLSLNLGRGQGQSVLQMLKTFEIANKLSIPYQFTDRRAGDLAEYWADVSLAKAILNWSADRNMNDMCLDSWRWWKNFRSNSV